MHDHLYITKGMCVGEASHVRVRVRVYWKSAWDGFYSRRWRRPRRSRSQWWWEHTALEVWMCIYDCSASLT